VTVYGGDPDDIAEAIFASAPAGCEMLGSSSVTVVDSIGQGHAVHFNKATRVSIYVDVTLTVDGSFSHDSAVTEITDTLIGYVGGEDSEGTFHNGLLPGENVIYQKLIALVMDTAGVVDVSLTVGESDDPTGTSNVSIGASEVAETKGSYIDIEVS